MKKLMIAAAIVCAAAFAQAASFNWATSGKMVDATDKTTGLTAFPDGGKVVLVYLGNGSDADWANAVAVQDGTIGASGSKKSKVNGTFGFTYNDSQKDYVDGDTFGIMFEDKDGKLSFLKQATDDADITSTYVLAGITGSTWSGPAYGASAVNFYAAVPEPTSGLLLILGVAGLALRRRRA